MCYVSRERTVYAVIDENDNVRKGMDEMEEEE